MSKILLITLLVLTFNKINADVPGWLNLEQKSRYLSDSSPYIDLYRCTVLSGGLRHNGQGVMWFETKDAQWINIAGTSEKLEPGFIVFNEENQFFISVQDFEKRLYEKRLKDSKGSILTSIYGLLNIMFKSFKKESMEKTLNTCKVVDSFRDSYFGKIRGFGPNDPELFVEWALRLGGREDDNLFIHRDVLPENSAKFCLMQNARKPSQEWFKNHLVNYVKLGMKGQSEALIQQLLNSASIEEKQKAGASIDRFVVALNQCSKVDKVRATASQELKVLIDNRAKIQEEVKKVVKNN